MPKRRIYYRLEVLPYGSGSEAFGVWRVFLPLRGGFTNTVLKATGPTKEAAWANYEARSGVDEFGICRGRPKTKN